MSGREAKFCLDRNQVRWVLLEGIINRKTQQDDPDKGTNLPVEKIQAIEKITVERHHSSPLAKPAFIIGVVILGLFGWLSTVSIWAGLPGLIVGALVMLWGLKRLSGTTEQLEAFKIVAPGFNVQDWTVVGSHHEVMGFIEGLRAEMQAAPRH